jgi:hypothetical protein
LLQIQPLLLLEGGLGRQHACIVHRNRLSHLLLLLLLLLLLQHLCCADHILICNIHTMIICLGGVSGSGKSTLRQSHPLLRRRDIAFFDIADHYAEAEACNRALSARQAFEELLQDIYCHLDEYPGSNVVVEAFFEPRGWQRAL